MSTIRLDKFTNREISKVTSPSKGITYIYPNERPAILGVTLTSSGTRTFHVKATVHGQSKRISIPGGSLDLMTVSEARERAPEIIAAALTGNTPAEQRKRQKELQEQSEKKLMTLHNLTEEYLTKQQKKLDKPMKDSTANDYRKRLKSVFSEYLEEPVSSITPAIVDLVMEERGKASLSALRALKAVCNYGIKTGLPIVNPVPEKLASYGRKQTYLKEAYFEDWFDAVYRLPEEEKQYYLFLLFTGVRADTEAGALTWANIDWKSESFLLTDTKNQRNIELPLPSYLVSMLKLRKQKQGRVFPGGEYKSAREQVIKSIGYHFTRHDLRRTFMTIAEGIDVSWLSVKRLSNHISQEHGVTEGYVIINLERLRKASRAIESEILRLAKRS